MFSVAAKNISPSAASPVALAVAVEAGMLHARQSQVACQLAINMGSCPININTQRAALQAGLALIDAESVKPVIPPV